MSFRPVNNPSSQAVVTDNTPSISTINNSRRDMVSPESIPDSASYPLRKQSSSNSDSQATILSTSSNESNRVFTPTKHDRTTSNGATSSGQGSSQESQLVQLSQLAAVQEKMPDIGSRFSVKRTADGAIKEPATSPSTSPRRHSSHSRNISGVSIASTASSRVTELSSELKTRLSYAMLKVNHGWQSRTIDEVENLASRSGSPASSNSTIPGVARSSASPQTQVSHRPIPLSVNPPAFQSQPPEGAWKTSPTSPRSHSISSHTQNGSSLAPPVSIQPHRTESHARRNSNPKYTPMFLSPRSHQDNPHSPALPSLNVSPDNRNLRVAADPMVISPTHNNREKDAMEALLFMSSPGNSANMKNHFPNSSQPISSSLRNGASAMPSGVLRTALPTSAPKRKSLPNGRPAHSSQPLPAAHSPKKRVGFGKSPSTLSEMDLDDPTSPRRHAAYVRPVASSARKANGTAGDGVVRGKYLLPLASGLSRAPRPKPRLSYEHLDEVLDRVAAEASSSESEGEIELPGRREGSGMRA